MQTKCCFKNRNKTATGLHKHIHTHSKKRHTMHKKPTMTLVQGLGEQQLLIAPLNKVKIGAKHISGEMLFQRTSTVTE